MSGSTNNLEINYIIIYYSNPELAMKILSSYLCLFKKYYGFTWIRVASQLNTNYKTLRKIRKGNKPITINTYADLLQRLSDSCCPKPEKLSTKELSSQHKGFYHCHPDCPFIEHYQKERTLEELINIIK